MGFIRKLFGTNREQGNDRPPKPEPEPGQKEVERTRYEATVEYRNGDTETFDCYGIYSKSGNHVVFNTDPYGKRGFDRLASYSYDRRKVNYETLSREPILEEICTDTFLLEFTVDHEWGQDRVGYRSNGRRKWRESHTDVELTVISHLTS